MSDDQQNDLIQAARGLAHMQEHHGAMAETPTILRKCADEIERLRSAILAWQHSEEDADQGLWDAIKDHDQ